MLLQWKDDPRLLIRMAGNDGISFATNTSETKERDADAENTHQEEAPTTHANTTMGQRGRGRGSGYGGGRGGHGGAHDNIQCFRCGAMGHYASQCPKTLEDAQRMLEENNKMGTNMLQHTITDEAITETTNEMTFASLGVDETEDNDTSFVFTQDVIGRPTTWTFIHFIDNNLLPNCPVNHKDGLRAEQIFGPDIGSLKGKTVRWQPPRVVVEEVSLPATIQQHYQEVTLACDIMYVNKIPFLMSISQLIRFGTAQHIKNQQSTTIVNGIRGIHQLYLQCGFRIRNPFMDGQFEPLRADLCRILGLTTFNSLLQYVNRLVWEIYSVS